MNAADESDDPIIGGKKDAGDPSVVAIFAHQPGEGSGSLCTGSVVSPRAVLTAAHCVDPDVVGAGNVFEVLVGPTLNSPSQILAVASTTFDSAFNPDALERGHDVAIVKLAQPTTLPALPFNTKALTAAAAGARVRLVGYGSSSHRNTGAGTKRMVTTSIADVSAALIQIGTTSKQTCHGDSGGPAFETIDGVETIVGVTSFGDDASNTDVCIGGGYDTRVDKYARFINANL